MLTISALSTIRSTPCRIGSCRSRHAVANIQHYATVRDKPVHGGVGLDVRRRIARNDLAIDQNRDAVREAEDDAHVVLDHHQSRPSLIPAE